MSLGVIQLHGRVKAASAAACLLSHGRGLLEDDPRVVLGLGAAAEGQDGPLLDSATGGVKRDAERFYETGRNGGEISIS
jgi:hypothetical protein